MILTKRIYEASAASDGYRVLVDRLWPRGVSKEKAALGEWLKGVAPSSELRVWYGHDPKKFPEFSRRYEAELINNPAVNTILELEKRHKTLTLLYAAKTPLNEATVLQKFLEEKLDSA